MDWTQYRYLALITLFFSSSTTAAEELAQYPGAEVVNTRQDSQPATHVIILGSLKKIQHQVEPEAVEYVKGIRSSTTYYVPNERRTALVRDFYRAELEAAGQMLFACSGRDCGSSSSWANTVFEQAVLYGPEQYQHYLLARLDTGEYRAVYVAMRGTLKLYVHVETTVPEDNQPVDTAGKQRARQVYASTDVDRVVTALRTLLAKRDDLVVYLVVHQALVGNENVDVVIARSQRIADQIKRRVDNTRVVARGLGPLSPNERYGPDRVELIVLK